MTPDQLADLLGVAAAVPRMPDAACRTETWMADLEVGSSRERIDGGIEICLGCRELQRCSDWLDSLPVDQQVRGVVAARMVDPAANQTARAVMAAELAARRPKPPRQAKSSGGPRRLRATLLSAVDHAGPEGLTVREAAAALYGPTPSGTQVELARQAIHRLIARGVLCRVSSGGRGGLSRYVRVDALEAAS